MGQEATVWDPTGGRGRAGHGRPPFGDTIIPAWHLDRPCVAYALDVVEWDVLRARKSGALVAPAGFGRTHLLRVVGERINPVQWESVYVPSCTMDFESFKRFVWGLLGAEPPSAGEVGDELERRLRDHRTSGRSLLVLVDDAEAMPLETLRACLDLAEENTPSLVFLFAYTAGKRAEERLVAEFEQRTVVRLEEVMTESEVSEYLLHRLARAGTSPEVVERFTEDVISRLHVRSAGLPVPLHTLAQVLVETPASRPDEAWPAFLRDERGVIAWLAEDAEVEAAREAEARDPQAGSAADPDPPKPAVRRTRRRRKRAIA